MLSKDKIAKVRMSCGLIFNKIKDIRFKEIKINNEINLIIENLKKDADRDIVKSINGLL